MRHLRSVFLLLVGVVTVAAPASAQLRHRRIYARVHTAAGHFAAPYLYRPGFGYSSYYPGYGLGYGGVSFGLSLYAAPGLIVVPPPAAPTRNYVRGADPYRTNRSYYGRVSPEGLFYRPESDYVDYLYPQRSAPAAARRAAPAVAPEAIAPEDDAVDDDNNALEGIPAPPPKPFQPRVSNETSRVRATKYVAYGDALFAEQKQHSALQRYKTAAKASPDLADIHFRQGFALVATHRYGLAAEAFKRGLALAPAGGQITIDALYQDNRMAKESHLEALAQAVAQNADNADYWFVLGMFLRHDGQAKRANKFFRRAKQLRGAAPYLDGLLEKTAGEKTGIDA